MIIRQGGGNSGIADYLENGAKHGRHYSRDELDSRIVIDGDLEITDRIIDSIEDKGQERYLHITLSFNEPDITTEKIQSVYADYKDSLLSAYEADEINTYAEIHWPKTQQLLDKTTGEMYDRFPHVHMVIPKQNLLTGRYTNPTGMYERNINIWEAIQEDVNNKHGLKSPAHSPRISLENYKVVLDRHKAKEFKSQAGELKQSIFNAVESSGIRSWSDFREEVAKHGEVITRNEGKPNEYLAVKRPEKQRYTNLNNPIFSKEYIENRELPRKPLTQYQIDNRLKQWELVSKELKYIDDASAHIKKQYRELDDTGKHDFLTQREAKFYEQHRLSEQEFEFVTNKPSHIVFRKDRYSERYGLHGLPPQHLVHDRGGWSKASRAELLLSTDEGDKLRIPETNKDAGLLRAVYPAARVIPEKANIKSLSSQIIFDLEEDAAISEAAELEQFKEIRLNLSPELVLAYAQSHYLIDPEEHKHFKAKDGSARISFGKYNYNVSDFFTKGLGVEWSETKNILLALYDSQLENQYTRPVSNDIIKDRLIQFEEGEYLYKIEQHRKELDAFKKRERDAIRELNHAYRLNVRNIYKVDGLTFHERHNKRAIEAFNRLVLEEELKADFYAERERINEIKYPFSEHFKNFLTNEAVIDMSMIDDQKKKWGHLAEEPAVENQILGTQEPSPLNGREAARRAKLLNQLANQGKPHTKYGYSFKDLKPEQKKESVVFYHDNQKLFEARPDKVLVPGALDSDKTATALVYALQRFGNPLDIAGNKEFKDQIVEVAALGGIDVKFTDPVLNDQLARRLEELGIEQNAISAEGLTLNADLPEAEAIDTALRESKEREIEADLSGLTTEVKELASVSIMQRRIVHDHEPATAKTAELDLAVYENLSMSPAMQAHFAADMAKLAVENEDYKQVMLDSDHSSEIMLASHAAVKFADELEQVYNENRPVGEDFKQDFTVPAPQPASHLDEFDTAAAAIIVKQLQTLDKVEFSPVAGPAHVEADHTMQDRGPASIERNQDGGWTVTAEFTENGHTDIYRFDSDDIEQAAKNFVFVSNPGDTLVAADLVTDQSKLELLESQLEQGRGVINGFDFAEKGNEVNNGLSAVIDFADNQTGDVQFMNADNEKFNLVKSDNGWEVSQSSFDGTKTFSSKLAAQVEFANSIYQRGGFESLSGFIDRDEGDFNISANNDFDEMVEVARMGDLELSQNGRKDRAEMLSQALEQAGGYDQLMEQIKEREQVPAGQGVPVGRLLGVIKRADTENNLGVAQEMAEHAVKAVAQLEAGNPSDAAILGAGKTNAEVLQKYDELIAEKSAASPLFAQALEQAGYERSEPVIDGKATFVSELIADKFSQGEISQLAYQDDIQQTKIERDGENWTVTVTDLSLVGISENAATARTFENGLDAAGHFVESSLIVNQLSGRRDQIQARLSEYIGVTTELNSGQLQKAMSGELEKQDPIQVMTTQLIADKFSQGEISRLSYLDAAQQTKIERDGENWTVTVTDLSLVGISENAATVHTFENGSDAAKHFVESSLIVYQLSGRRDQIQDRLSEYIGVTTELNSGQLQKAMSGELEKQDPIQVMTAKDEAQLIEQLRSNSFRLDNNLSSNDLKQIESTLYEMLPLNNGNEFWQRHEILFDELSSESISHEHSGLDLIERQISKALDQIDSKCEMILSREEADSSSIEQVQAALALSPEPLTAENAAGKAAVEEIANIALNDQGKAPEQAAREVIENLKTVMQSAPSEMRNASLAVAALSQQTVIAKDYGEVPFSVMLRTEAESHENFDAYLVDAIISAGNEAQMEQANAPEQKHDIEMD